MGVSLSLLTGFFILRNKPLDHTVSELEVNKKLELDLKKQIFIFDELQVNADLNSNVAFITGVDGSKASFVQRDHLVLRLQAKLLNEEDFAALMAFMSEDPQDQGRHLAFFSLKNNIMSFLIESERYPIHLAAKMIQDMTTPMSNQVWREYIAQYVPDLIAKFDSKSKAYANITNQLIDALWEVTSEKKGALAGTSLLGLHKLKKNHPQINRSELAERTSYIAQNNEYDVATRMGAVRLLDEKNIDGVKQIAFDESESVSLRMAAIHKANQLSNGDSLFQEELRQTFLESGSDKRLQLVVKNLIK